MIFHVMQSVAFSLNNLSLCWVPIDLLSLCAEFKYPKSHYAQSVIMLSVIKPSVVAPYFA